MQIKLHQNRPLVRGRSRERETNWRQRELLKVTLNSLAGSGCRFRWRRCGVICGIGRDMTKYFGVFKKWTSKKLSWHFTKPANHSTLLCHFFRNSSLKRGCNERQILCKNCAVVRGDNHRRAAPLHSFSMASSRVM
jgi:hypothetical protein